MTPCSGLTATWCPLHGTCQCTKDASGERSLVDERCPLHSSTSDHALDVIEAQEGAAAVMARAREAGRREGIEEAARLCDSSMDSNVSIIDGTRHLPQNGDRSVGMRIRALASTARPTEARLEALGYTTERPPGGCADALGMAVEEVCLGCLRTRADHGDPPHEFISNLLGFSLPDPDLDRQRQAFRAGLDRCSDPLAFVGEAPTGTGRDECEHGSLRRKCEVCFQVGEARDEGFRAGGKRAATVIEAARELLTASDELDGDFSGMRLERLRDARETLETALRALDEGPPEASRG